ncbi:hypothetical protein ACNKHL_09975 [Shigella flexneri]
MWGSVCPGLHVRATLVPTHKAGALVVDCGSDVLLCLARGRPMLVWQEWDQISSQRSSTR